MPEHKRRVRARARQARAPCATTRKTLNNTSNPERTLLTLKTLRSLLVLLTLILSACNPGNDTPPATEDPTPDENTILSNAPLSGYEGDDATVYFVIPTAGGEELMEAGFIKNGELTLNPGEPAQELQSPWLASLPESVQPDSITYEAGEERAETITVTHVSSISIGEGKNLFITGAASGDLRATAEGNAASTLAGLTWSSHPLHVAFNMQAPDVPQAELELLLNGWSVIANHQSSYFTSSLNRFTVRAADPATLDFLRHYNPLSHGSPFHAPTGDDEEPGEEPEEPETPEPGDPDEPSPEDPEEPAPTDPEEPGTPEEPEEPDPEEPEDPEPSPNTFTVHGYTGPADDVYADFLPMDYNDPVVRIKVGTITGEGVFTFDPTVTVPSELLTSVTEAHIPNDNPDARLLTIDLFTIGDSNGSIFAGSNDSIRDNYYDFAVGDREGQFIYADAAVNITLNEEDIDLDLNLEPGWNFAISTITEVLHNEEYDYTYPHSRSRNGDPHDLNWYWLAPVEPTELVVDVEEEDLRPGGIHVATAILMYSDGIQEVLDHTEVEWSSSEPVTASINENGVIETHAYGSTTITAYHPATGLSGSSSLLVTGLNITDYLFTSRDITAQALDRPTGTPSTYHLGTVDESGYFQFNPTPPGTSSDWSEIRNYAEDKDTQIAKTGRQFHTDNAGIIWVGPELPADHDPSNPSFYLEHWYADRPTSITAETSTHSYDVHLTEGWNRIITNVSSNGGSIRYELTSEPFKNDWRYYEPEQLIIRDAHTKTPVTELNLSPDEPISLEAALQYAFNPGSLTTLDLEDLEVTVHYPELLDVNPSINRIELTPLATGGTAVDFTHTPSGIMSTVLITINVN